MISQAANAAMLEVRIGRLIGQSGPFGEGGERIVNFPRLCLVNEHARIGNSITKHIAWLDAESLPYGAREHSLAFHRDA
jgi:hypothetical protein